MGVFGFNGVEWRSIMADSKDVEKWADSVIADALSIVSGGGGGGVAGEAIKNALEALKEQAILLKEYTLALKAKGALFIEIRALSKVMADTTRVIDDISRLWAFKKGDPDSRVAISGDILKGLTDEQVSMVQRWLGENEARQQESR